MKEFIGREHLLINDLICHRCFDNQGIIKFIKSNGRAKGCSFCKSSLRSHHFGEVIEYINTCLCNEYEDPANSMAYETREGGYQGATVYDTSELLEHVGLETKDSSLIEKIARCLPNQAWCEIDPYGMREHDELDYDWKNFSSMLKYKCRFMFLAHGSEKKGYFEEPRLLVEILNQLKKGFEETRLIKKLKSGTIIYRARRFDKKKPFPLKLGKICTPPQERAENSRMSPAGIPMFYGAGNCKTALKEIGSKGGWMRLLFLNLSY
ncbi:MAG: hypothetical protein A2X86_16070 [Bdellovibrionales bacterium GWA2_49_15]|nr:MAG: hypothetical protein A2X86_16070 [Bdellovibrionales bacterium GWA2_49_15]